MQAPSDKAPAIEGLSIGRLSDRTGTAPDTIRYYERLGLMPRAPRSAAGHRSFGARHVQRLLFIRRARALGFSLDAIQSLLSLAAPSRRSCASVRRMALEHLEDVRARLAELQRLEAALAETVANCSGDTVPTCAVLSILEAPP
jgi:MerR family mercuric resistance operon transcriptional regulator